MNVHAVSLLMYAIPPRVVCKMTSSCCLVIYFGLPSAFVIYDYVRMYFFLVSK